MAAIGLANLISQFILHGKDNVKEWENLTDDDMLHTLKLTDAELLMWKARRPKLINLYHLGYSETPVFLQKFISLRCQ